MMNRLSPFPRSKPTGRAVGALLLVALLVGLGFGPVGAPARAAIPSGPASPVPVRASTSPFQAMAAPPPTFPHAGPPPLGPSSYSGHYYAGVDFAGPNATSTDVGVNIEVPEDTPQTGDFYYVILSVWDSAGSYDQLGFTNSNGTWGVAYSWTSPCAGTYYYSTNAYGLSAGVDYRFDMQLVSGAVLFTVSLPTGLGVWTYSAASGGTNFILASTYTCNGASSYDYTDYEEVYTTTGPVPPYAFFFRNNTENGHGVNQWSAWESSGAPATISVTTGGTEAIVENVPFGLSAASPLLAEVDPAGRTYSENVSVTRYSADSTLSASLAGSVPNATLSLAPSRGSAPFVFSVQLHVGVSTRPGYGYPLEITVTDSSGVYARLGISMDVAPTLLASLPVANPPISEVNRPVSLSESPIGGTGVYTYLWSGLPSGCPENLSSVTCTPNSTGNYSVSVAVSDSFGFLANSSALELAVEPALQLSVLGNRTSVDVGQSLAFTATPSGGDGGIRYAWKVGSIASCTATGELLTCVARSAGTLTATATATDQSGARASATNGTSLLVDPMLSVPSGTLTGEVGRPVNLTVAVSGGLPGVTMSGEITPYRLAWFGLGADCSSTDAPTIQCVWSSPGQYPIEVQATDANNFTSPALRETVTIVPELSVSIRATPSSVLGGQSVLLQATTDGGLGPFHFAWAGLPSGCGSVDAANLTCTVPASGTVRVSVAVTDALGGHATGLANVSVAPSFLGFPGTDGYLVLGAGVALLAVGAVLALRRRNRIRREGDEPGAGAAE